MVQTEQQDLRDRKVMSDRKGQQVLMEQLDHKVMSDLKGQQVLMEQLGRKDHKEYKVTLDHKDQRVQME